MIDPLLDSGATCLFIDVEFVKEQRLRTHYLPCAILYLSTTSMVVNTQIKICIEILTGQIPSDTSLTYSNKQLALCWDILNVCCINPREIRIRAR